MTGLDWIILGIVILLALFGWAQGFVAGALALVGFAIGAWIGTRLGPLLLPDGERLGVGAGVRADGRAGRRARCSRSGFEGLGRAIARGVRTPGGGGRRSCSARC